jgi:hypothetical protein
MDEHGVHVAPFAEFDRLPGADCEELRVDAGIGPDGRQQHLGETRILEGGRDGEPQDPVLCDGRRDQDGNERKKSKAASHKTRSPRR